MSTEALDARRTGVVRFRPIRRSRTKRNAEAANARRHLSKYQGLLGLQATAESRTDVALAQASRASSLQALLQARAAVDRAIWLETSGRLGTQYAPSSTTMRTLETSNRTHDPEHDTDN
jgi:hypothetical protein